MTSSMAMLFLILMFFGVNNSKCMETLFDYHLKKKLNVPSTAQSQSLQVKDKMKCFGKCIGVDWCQSGNYKTTPEDNGLHVCQLLPSDRFTPSNAFNDDPEFDNFNVKTPCHIKNKPCLNEGKCVSKNNKHRCECKNGWSGEQCEIEPPKSCQALLHNNSSLTSDLYSIYPTVTNPIKVYCDMKTDGGGWTLVYSYTFTNYGDFSSSSNAVTPRPSWPTSGNVPLSTTPPLSETDYAAVDFNLWKIIGSNELIVKSNINHWIQCKDGTGSLVNWRPGSVSCTVIKNVASQCLDNAPAHLTFPNIGPMFTDGFTYYYFDCFTGANWPTHDPCGANGVKHKTGVINPHGNIYVR